MTAPRNILFFLILAHSATLYVHSHALVKVRVRKEDDDLRVDPGEAIAFAGANVSFTCSHPENVTFLWEFSSTIQAYEVVHGSSSNSTFFSRITLFGVSRFMSSGVTCSVEGRDSRAVGYLTVNAGVQIGGACHNSTDCITDRALCLGGACECPRNTVRLRLTESGFDVCREMIYSLYDPCEFSEQCSHLVDPKSVCNSVCVCAPYARDRKGRCVSLNDISYNRSQEMYRVGLIAVTCIIILIVAMSLWVTLKRSCHEQSNNGLNGTTQTDVSYPEGIGIDVPDKPPSYDDVIVSDDVVTAPPNIKDALKHCMTAKRLLRQVSAPAGQLLPQQGINLKPDCDTKKISET